MNNTTTLQEPHTSLPDADLPAGTVIDGRFSVITKIGTGGMGAVYLADDTRLKRRVAVKVISSDADEIALKRFTREVRLMAGIHSPEIVQVHDFGRDALSGSNYYVMDALLLSPEEAAAICRERLRCSPPIHAPADASNAKAAPLSLDGVLAGDRALPEDTTAHLALEILSALRLIHENEPQIVHRDLKPSNLLFAADGRLMLSDFGIAKARLANDESTSTLTMLGAGPGTPLYAAPEQKDGRKITVATDFYSFGLVLYRMLTGGLPGTASTLLPSDVSAHVSQKWNRLLTALLQRDPGKRLCDHEEVRRQLMSILAEWHRKTRLRVVCRNLLTRGLPAVLILSVILTASFHTCRRLTEWRAREAAAELARQEAMTQKPDIERSFDESLAYFAALTNNLVVPREGEPLVIRSGETMLVPTSNRKSGQSGFMTAPWNGPRPSKIILDGGRILIGLPYDEITSILAMGPKIKESLLANWDYLVLPETIRTATAGKSEGFPDLIGQIDVPIEITPQGGSIEADDRFVYTAIVRSKLTSADGSPVQINFSCGALSVLHVDKAAFGPGVTYGPGRSFLLVDYSGARPEIVKWVE